MLVPAPYNYMLYIVAGVLAYLLIVFAVMAVSPTLAGALGAVFPYVVVAGFLMIVAIIVVFGLLGADTVAAPEPTAAKKRPTRR